MKRGRVLSIAAIHTAFYAALIVGPLASLVLAADLPPGVVKVEGLSFFCPTCRKADERHCELSLDGEITQIRCSELLDLLLNRALEALKVSGRDGARSYPSAEELNAFLLNQTRSNRQTAVVLKLLAAADGGTELLDRYAGALCARHPDAIIRLVEEGSSVRSLWRAVFEGSDLIGDRPQRPEVISMPEELLDSKRVTAGEQSPIDSSSPRASMVYTAALLLTIFGGTLLWRHYQYRAARSRTDPLAASAEREELRLLRRYFGLSPSAGESELARSYRKRARTLHPDTSVGTTEAFTHLNDQYRRAKQLLSRAGNE